MGSGGAQRLSKSRYMSGLQCPKMLWWRVHEPDAPELVAGEGLQAILTRGQRVGELAREQVPGGALIDRPHHEFEGRVAATAEALANGARAIYEASFLEDGVFVAVDILERRRNGFVLIEVKSTLDVKEEHLPDVAVQVHVVRRAGLTVSRAQVMHLNRECHYPDLSNLFVRENVTTRIRPALRAVPKEIASLTVAISGSLPEVATGPHCNAPYICPFIGRCWPRPPEHHVSTLYGIRASKVAKLQAEGIQTLFDLSSDFTASEVALRQIRSVKARDIVAERGLRWDLARLKPPLAFLDFETISPAVPVWPGCHPYEQVPVQFSCHVLGPSGLEHFEWLAEGPGDPREEFARKVISACAGAKMIVAYNAPFEKRCVKSLADALPDLSSDLTALSKRLRDLLPIVRDHVYHPDFGGSFSLKSVLPALVPGLGYDDLEIQGGSAASTALETLLLNAAAFSQSERQALRGDLLRYCERDTLAMVRLHSRLRELAGLQGDPPDGQGAELGSSFKPVSEN
jgi:predicted RecB family nuclease